MAGSIQQLVVSAELENLVHIREFLKAQALAMGMSIEAAMDLVTAVDEAATNIIVHGYGENSGQNIEVEAATDGKSLLIRLMDRAPLYDPLIRSLPDTSVPLAERSIGGMGIYMMRQSVDEIIHEPRLGGGNILTLRKSG